MIEKRMNQSFQNLFEKYGYSSNVTSKKSLFEELNECDKPAQNETSIITEGTHDNQYFYVRGNNKTYLVLARDEQGAKEEAQKNLKIQNPEIQEAKFEVDPNRMEGWQKVQNYCKANNIEIVRADDDGTYWNRMHDNASNESLDDTSIDETLAQGTVTTYEEKIIDKLLAYMIDNLGVDQKQITEICKEAGMKPEDILGLVGQEDETN